MRRSEGRTYTYQDACKVIKALTDRGFRNVSLIGSIAKGKVSKHDIDILIPGEERTPFNIKTISEVLEAPSFDFTDWGGIYFHNTKYGDVDIFFTTKDFDY